MVKIILVNFIITCFTMSLMHSMTAPVIRDISVVAPAETEDKIAQVNNSIEEKNEAVMDLVNRAIEHLQNNSVEQTCHDFTREIAWRNGEMCIYLIDKIGRILCYGQDMTVLWKSINIAKSLTEKTVYEEIQEVAVEGGWINFMWHNGYQSAYFKYTEKDGDMYIIGSGFYPESPEYTTKYLVEQAALAISQKGIAEVAGEISNPVGPFVKGSISLALYDFDGNCLANADAPSFIGQNVLTLFDKQESDLVKNNVEVAKSKRGYGWRDVLWRGAKLRNYIQRITDPRTQRQYYITGGYYPDVNRDELINFVRRAHAHIKGTGAKDAFLDFNNNAGEYVKGPLSIFVYDFEGKNVAEGKYPSFVGKNFIERKDAEGTLVIRKMISMAQKYGKGSFSYIENNAYKTIYFEVVDTPDGKFIVGSGYFPASKEESVQSLVYKAADHLKLQETHKAFSDFTDPVTEFFKGDLSIFVYSIAGSLIVDGIQHNMLWKDFTVFQDDEGRKGIEDLIALARSGGGWMASKINGIEIKTYVRAVAKVDQTGKEEAIYIVGSKYFI